MTKKDSPIIDDLASEIESAVEDLFSTYDEIEIDPVTSEVKPVSAKQSGKKHDAAEINEKEADIDFGEEEVLELDDDVLSQLNHALHSLEWEVSESNIASVKEKLTQFQAEFAYDNPDELKEVVDRMRSILDGMEQAPQTVPTFAAKALKDTVLYFQAFKTGEFSKDTPTIESVKKDLLASTPQRAVASQPSSLTFESETIAVEEAAPPLETVTTAPPLETEPDKEQEAPHIPADQETPEAAGETGLPSRRPQDLPDRLIKTLQAHISMLDQCVNRIVPLENLFARTPGYGKLHIINKKIREQLESQKDSLAHVLKGDYRQFPAYLSSQPIPSVKGEHQQDRIPCPWNRLAFAPWKGKIVAFVPGQIAYAEEIKGGEKLQRKATLPLASLKSWPWTKLQPLLSGELAVKEEKTLSGLVLPFLKHPWIFQAFSDQTDGEILLILYHNNKGGAALLDTQPQQIPVSSRWAWEPSDRGEEYLAGHLIIYGDYIPVLNIEDIS